jgi:capsid protein
MKELESAYKLGFKSASDITSAMGRQYADVVRQKAEEAAIRQIITAEIEEKYGVKIDAREIAMMTPNDQPDPDNAPVPEPNRNAE